MRGNSPLGEAVVNVTADARGLDKGLDSAKRQVAGFTDDVQGRLNKLGSGLKGSILTGVGLGAGIAGFQALSGAISGAVDWMSNAVVAAREDEESINRLGASLEQNVPAWQRNTEGIEENIEAAQRLGFTDEELRDSMTVLVGATHDVTKAQEYMATAMDLARFKGIDLKTASEALIKVSGGHYRMLAQLGIQMDHNASSAEALAAVQKVAGGQAEAYAETTSGMADSIGIAFDEISEDVGKLLLPAVREFLQFVQDDVLPGLESFVTDLNNIGPALDQFSLDLNNATGGLLGWSAAELADGHQRDQFLDNLRSGALEAASVLSSGAPLVQKGAATFISGIYTEIDKSRRESIAAIRALPGDLAKALADGQKAVDDGIAGLVQLMDESLSDAEKIAHLRGVLASEELQRGLEDERADVRAKALAVQQDALDQLKLLESGAADAAVDAGTTFAEQLRLQKVAAGNAARDMARGALGAIEGTDWYGAGEDATLDFAAGAQSHAAIQAVLAAGARVASTFGGFLEGESPPPMGPLHHIDDWGVNLAETLADGFRSAVPELDLGLSGIQPSGEEGSSMGGVQNVYNITAEGRPWGLEKREDFIEILQALSPFYVGAAFAASGGG